MSSGKRRNPLNLSLPPTVNEEGMVTDGDKAEEDKKAAESLDAQLRQLSLSGSQVQRMNEWISQKEQVLFIHFLSKW